MPLRGRRSYRRRAPMRRYARPTRRTGRRRFSRKKFARRTANMTQLGNQIGRTAMVKLNYSKEFEATLAVTTGVWSAITFPLGSPTTYTYPVNATTASICFLGSHCCMPLGSPKGVSAHVPIEDFPAGLQDWGLFFTQAICYGSSIRVEMMPSGSTAVTVPGMRYVLLAIASEVNDDISSPNEVSGTTRTTLDALGYETLATYPGAKSGYVKSAFTSPTRIKAFRKTKTMLGFKSTSDVEALRMTLPVPSNPDLGQNGVTNTATTNLGSLAWLWYFRLFPLDRSVEEPTMYTFRIKYYLKLLNRTMISVITST